MKITRRQQLRRIISEAMRNYPAELRDEQEDAAHYEQMDDPEFQHKMDSQDREKTLGSAEGLAQEMQHVYSSVAGMSPAGWIEDQDGVWVEAVVAEYMDKQNMPGTMSTTDPPMDTMRAEAIQIFLSMR